MAESPNGEADDDPRLEFIYREAVRGLNHQQNLVESMNTRAGSLIFAPAFANSLLGGTALSDGLALWEWVAVALLFSIGGLIVLMLWPTTSTGSASIRKTCSSSMSTGESHDAVGYAPLACTSHQGRYGQQLANYPAAPGSTAGCAAASAAQHPGLAFCDCGRLSRGTKEGDDGKGDHPRSSWSTGMTLQPKNKCSDHRRANARSRTSPSGSKSRPPSDPDGGGASAPRPLTRGRG